MYFVRISRTHHEVAKLELEELLVGFKYKWLEDNFLQVDGIWKEISVQLSRSGAVRSIFELIHISSKRDITSIFEMSRRIETSSIRGKTFRVRVYKISPVAWHTVPVERTVGSILISKEPELEVDLKSPDVTIAVVAWKSGVGVGFLKREQPVSDLMWRAPKNLPHFRGGAMKQTFSRLLVNLHQEEEGSYVADPFCGHGGVLYEIYEVGYNPIGIEIDRRIIDQAIVNLRAVGYEDVITLIHGDALKRPFRRGATRYFITDPPYAIQTTTSGRTVEEITEQWLNSYQEEVTIVMVTPNETLKELPDRWKVLKQGNDYVHRSLVRRVRVISNG